MFFKTSRRFGTEGHYVSENVNAIIGLCNISFFVLFSAIQPFLVLETVLHYYQFCVLVQEKISS
jgi:hypothetical protein